MGRWTQYDEDNYRLPEGMRRTGYDADTGRYYFTDRDGSVWQGAEGAEFSEMTRVSAGEQRQPEELDSDIEAIPTRSDGYAPLATDPVRASHFSSFSQVNSFLHKGHDASAYYKRINAQAYKTLFPFFLLIGVIILLVWRVVLSPGVSPPPPLCSEKHTPYLVEPGDSCWEISQTHGCTLEQLRLANPDVNCDRLMPGMTVCLPEEKN